MTKPLKMNIHMFRTTWGTTFLYKHVQTHEKIMMPKISNMHIIPIMQHNYTETLNADTVTFYVLVKTDLKCLTLCFSLDMLIIGQTL